MKNKEIIIIGDRVLVEPDSEKNKTNAGLYLPPGISEKENVQSGTIVNVGPGYVIPNNDSSEPWANSGNEPRYIPLQVRIGDYAIFLKREAIEIEFEGKKYLIVPQIGILAIIRDNLLSNEIDELD
ncbi:MAG: co-chaperone GroES [Calditrichaeota bacterium]|nr:MAG: co-chaperone GroES [Calditrichota bacterium]